MQEDIIVLSGRGSLVTKINISFFVGNEGLNIFHLTTFFTKKNKTIFSKITKENNFLGAVSIFEGKWHRTTKMNITLSMENGCTKYCF